jgi:hypothetical protein
LRSAAPAVPTYIGGAFEALPRDRGIPKLRQITVAFGCPEPVEASRRAALDYLFIPKLEGG